MKRFVLVLGLLLAASLLAAPAQAGWVKKANNFVILYDTSGSMAKDYQKSGKSKLFFAETMLKTMNEQIPDLGYNAGLYDIAGLKTYYPLGKYDKAAFNAAVISLPDEVSAMGPSTPLGKALKALNPLLDKVQGKTVVYIISDGENTDDLRPYTEAKKIADKHDVCFILVSLSRWDDGGEHFRKITKLNDCSRVIDFDDVVKDPGILVAPIALRVPDVVVAETVVVVQEVPDAAVPVVAASNILFAFDKSDIQTEFEGELDEVAAYLKQYPSVAAVLSGYTDSTGPKDYNIWLSKQRAASVQKALVDRGVNADQLKIYWFGPENPLAPNTSIANRQQNRRVEFMFVIPQ